jgi:hypothetical protein
MVSGARAAGGFWLELPRAGQDSHLRGECVVSGGQLHPARPTAIEPMLGSR